MTFFANASSIVEASKFVAIFAMCFASLKFVMHPPLGFSVGHVVCRGAKKQMMRIYAHRIIAHVANKETVRNGATIDRVR